MCKLYAAEGNRSEEKTQLTLDIILNREEMELLGERVQHHREWEKKHNFTPVNYTERDELRFAIIKYLDELREKKNEPAGTGGNRRDVEHEGNFRKTVPAARAV